MEGISSKATSKASLELVVKFSSVARSCLTLCDPMDCSMPGCSVRHQFPKLAQTHVHRVSDAIQPSHPLSSPFSSCLQTFPASGSFLTCQFFTVFRAGKASLISVKGIKFEIKVRAERRKVTNFFNSFALKTRTQLQNQCPKSGSKKGIPASGIPSERSEA